MLGNKPIASGGSAFAVFDSTLATIAEVLAVNDNASILDHINRIIESLDPSDGLADNIVGHNHMTDSSAFNDVIFAHWNAHIIDSAGLNDTPIGRLELFQAVIDGLLASGAAYSELRARTMVVTALALNDLIVVSFREHIYDGPGLNELFSDNLIAYNLLLDSPDLNDTLGTHARLSVVVTDTVSTDESMDHALVAKNALSDGLDVFISMNIAGEEYAGFVLNTENLAVSEYSNFPFNSFGTLRGVYYGLAKDGLYELSGDDDSGTDIYAKVRTALDTVAKGKMCRIDSAYLGYNSTGKLVLKANAVNKDGKLEEHWYLMDQRASESHTSGRVPVGHGLASVYWSFELVNKDGCNFELDELKLYPIILNRRI